MSDITEDQQRRIEDALKRPPARAGGNIQPASRVEFCQQWPAARRLLMFLVSLPGVPQTIKDAVNAVISAGDSISDIIC